MFKPLLSPNNSPMDTPNFFEELRFPLLCSPKLDGIRCIVKPSIEHTIGVNLEVESATKGILRCKSRKFIDLPSKQVQELFSSYEDLDGELIVGNETDYDVYNRTQSHIMSEDKPHDQLHFRIFDYADESWAGAPFVERFAFVNDYLGMIKDHRVTTVEHTLCRDLEELLYYETTQLELGYEGIMMRNPQGVYKHNRATWKEGIIYKLKRFSDDEGTVVDFVEQMTNTNEKIRDELGNAKRSESKDGLVPANTLGKLTVSTDKWGILEIPCGKLTHPERKEIWSNRDQYKGAILKFRYFDHGIKDKPRLPRFVGWRSPMDL